MKRALVNQVTERRERLATPAKGALAVPALNLAISWDADRCAVFVGNREHEIDGLSGVSLQVSTWQSPPEISWIRPDKPGAHWLGVEFYVSEVHGRAMGKGTRIRLKAKISSEEAANLPFLELSKAEEVERDELIEALAAMRYHGAELSRGTEELRPEARPQVQTSRWWQPVDFSLLFVFAATLAVLTGLRWAEAPYGWAIAGSMGFYALVMRRWLRTLSRREQLPLENPSLAVLTVPTGPMLLLSIGLSNVATDGSAGAMATMFLVVTIIVMTAVILLVGSQGTLTPAVERSVPAERGSEGKSAIFFFYLFGGVWGLMPIAAGLGEGDWRLLAGGVTWSYILIRYLWTMQSQSWRGIWPDWRGPAGTLDRKIQVAEEKGIMRFYDHEESLGFHKLYLVRIVLALGPLFLLALVASPDPGLFTIPVLMAAMWAIVIFEFWVIAELKVETWDSIPLFGGVP